MGRITHSVVRLHVRRDRCPKPLGLGFQQFLKTAMRLGRNTLLDDKCEATAVGRGNIIRTTFPL